MKKLLILSGKGGTGKTTTTASFIRFSQAKVFADCDVDAPNLHLVSQVDGVPAVSDYYGSEKAWIDPEKCLGCGICADACRFHAIHETAGVYQADEYTCEGCGVCTAVCPHGAAALKEDKAGSLFLYEGNPVFSSAKLKMGRGNSGKLVSAVKSAMTEAAPPAELAIIDGSPGIGCPVISSINGVDLVVIVAEPSLSGLHDLKRIAETASIFRAKTAVFVNKYDLSLEKTAEIEAYCKEKEIPFLGRVPYDSSASKAINEGLPLSEIDCPARDALYEVYRKTMSLLDIQP